MSQKTIFKTLKSDAINRLKSGFENLEIIKAESI
jgi:hypothetical protein